MENIKEITKINDHGKILHINFNQDQGITFFKKLKVKKKKFIGCFACATETGFIIYNSYPFNETFSRGKTKQKNRAKRNYKKNKK